MSDQELRRCSDCRCTMLLELYFEKNRKGEYMKTCNKCREKRKKQRANPEWKAKRAEYYKKNQEHIKEQGRRQSKQYYEENKEDKLKKTKEYYETHKEEHAKWAKEWRENNIEYCKEKAKEYRENNKEHCAKLKKEWREKNIEHCKERDREYQRTHREERNAYNRVYEKNRRDTDPIFKMLKNMRRRMSKALKNNSKSASTIELLGCTAEECKEHLEKQFLPGMSWDNYGLYTFHIDHILPCDSFNLEDPEEQKKCFHYTNLQPLWAIDNLMKGNKIL